eukprot:6855586-Prymnesium_polylepis.1
MLPQALVCNLASPGCSCWVRLGVCVGSIVCVKISVVSCGCCCRYYMQCPRTFGGVGERGTPREVEDAAAVGEDEDARAEQLLPHQREEVVRARRVLPKARDGGRHAVVKAGDGRGTQL